MVPHYQSSFTLRSKSCRSSRRALFSTIIQPFDKAIILNDFHRCPYSTTNKKLIVPRYEEDSSIFTLYTNILKFVIVRDTRRKF